MKLTMTKDGYPRYFSAKLDWKEHFDSKEIEMLTANVVPMLIPPESVQGRKNNIIRYNISSYSTLDFYLSCILSKEQFAELLLQCISLFRQMQQLFLNYKNLVLDLDKIFMLLSDRSIHFIYLPLANSKRDTTYAAFFRKILQKASRSTYEQVGFLDACLAWLDRPAPFTLEEFESFVRCGGHTAAAEAVSPAAQPIYTMPRQQNERIYQPIPACPEPSFVSEVQGKTVCLSAPVASTVLLAAEDTKPQPRFFLTREKNGERIALDHFPFLIGKDAANVAYCISDNAAISRRHAEFILQDGICIVTDQKSTNKTYVNDCVLTPLVGQALANGDRLKLANEPFVFSQEM